MGIYFHNSFLPPEINKLLSEIHISWSTILFYEWIISFEFTTDTKIKIYQQCSSISTLGICLLYESGGNFITIFHSGNIFCYSVILPNTEDRKLFNMFYQISFSTLN